MFILPLSNESLLFGLGFIYCNYHIRFIRSFNKIITAKIQICSYEHPYVKIQIWRKTIHTLFISNVFRSIDFIIHSNLLLLKYENIFTNN